MRDLALGTNKEKGQLEYIPKDLRYKHFYLLGKTGVGKSSLLQRLILQDATKNYAVVVFDAGNLAKLVYETLPDEAMPRVRFFSIDTPIPYNPLVRHKGDIGRVENELFSLLDQLTIESSKVIPLTPRMKELLSIALRNTFQIHTAPTLSNLVAYLLQNSYKLRQQIGMEKMPSEFNNTYAGVKDRLRQVLRDGRVRRILCGGHKLDFNAVLDKGYILIVSLSLVEKPLVKMLGTLLFHGLQATIFERPEDKRPDVAIYVDEFQDYISSHYSAQMFRDIFRQGRKHNTCFTIAHQDFGDMDKGLLEAIHGNAAVLGCFSAGNMGASALAREMGDYALSQAILKQPDHELHVRVGNEVYPIQTYPPPKPKRTLPDKPYAAKDPADPFDLSPAYPQGDDDKIKENDQLGKPIKLKTRKKKKSPRI